MSHRFGGTPWQPSERFAALVKQLGGRADSSGEAFERLLAAWTDPSRRYHQFDHLAECLDEVDRLDVAPRLVGVVELALWYHDAIYDPRAKDSEERSAALLLDDARAMEIPAELAADAARCVRATAHLAGAAPSRPDVDLVLDIDLSILGRSSQRFSEFEHAVAAEYAHVPGWAFILGRGRFLASLLASPSIFRTTRFRERYEAKARANIALLLASRRYLLHRWFGGIYRRGRNSRFRRRNATGV